nr:unnamed protein product [Callosobruchus chinensis]
MISAIISRLVILLFGTLYPAYASYKAVRSKGGREYVKWMMYWIVFALFTCIETFTDIFLSWFPFYYEIKIIFVIWLLSPATKGSSILYRKFVHPMLSSKEQAKEQSYKQVLDLGSKGVTALMQTALKGGGGIVNQLKKSYSLSDLTDPCHDEQGDVTDLLITDPRLVRRKQRSPHRSSSTSLYFSEVDVRADRLSATAGVIQSTEDISSGYSSGEGLPRLLAKEPHLQRTGSVTRSSSRNARVTRSVSGASGATGRKAPAATSDESDENEVFDTNIVFQNDATKKTEERAESSSKNDSNYIEIV